jgi:hypothetical protein
MRSRDVGQVSNLPVQSRRPPSAHFRSQLLTSLRPKNLKSREFFPLAHLLTCSLRFPPKTSNLASFSLLLTCSQRLRATAIAGTPTRSASEAAIGRAGPHSHSLTTSKARTFPQTRGGRRTPRAIEISRELFKGADLFHISIPFCLFSGRPEKAGLRNTRCHLLTSTPLAHLAVFVFRKIRPVFASCSLAHFAIERPSKFQALSSKFLPFLPQRATKNPPLKPTPGCAH